MQANGKAKTQKKTKAQRETKKAKKGSKKERSLTCVVLPQPVSPATSTTRLLRTAARISSRNAAIGRLARACASCEPEAFTAAACAARAAATCSGVMAAALPFLFLSPLLMSLFLVPFSSSVEKLFFTSFSSSSSSPAKMPLASDSARATSTAVGGWDSKCERSAAAEAADSGRSKTPAALDFSFGL